LDVRGWMLEIGSQFVSGRRLLIGLIGAG